MLDNDFQNICFHRVDFNILWWMFPLAILEMDVKNHPKGDRSGSSISLFAKVGGVFCSASKKKARGVIGDDVCDMCIYISCTYNIEDIRCNVNVKHVTCIKHETYLYIYILHSAHCIEFILLTMESLLPRSSC